MFLTQFDSFQSNVWRNTWNVLCSKCFSLRGVENFHYAFIFSKYILSSNTQTRTNSKRWKWDRAVSHTSFSTCPFSFQALLIVYFFTCHQLCSYQVSFTILKSFSEKKLKTCTKLKYLNKRLENLTFPNI